MRGGAGGAGGRAEGTGGPRQGGPVQSLQRQSGSAPGQGEWDAILYKFPTKFLPSSCQVPTNSLYFKIYVLYDFAPQDSKVSELEGKLREAESEVARAEERARRLEEQVAEAGERERHSHLTCQQLQEKMQVMSSEQESLHTRHLAEVRKEGGRERESTNPPSPHIPHVGAATAGAACLSAEQS